MEREGQHVHRRGLLVETLHTGLLTDLYHPDAAYVSWRTGMNGTATFDLYTRRAPFESAYLLVAGLEQAVAFLREFGYTDDDIGYLRLVRDYDPAFLDELRRLKFTGDVMAMPEGTVAFPHEPLLRVTAPFREGLLVESGLLQAVNLATLIATKAARITTAAGRKKVSDFAFRRAQAPFVVTRSASIGGCVSTSFLAAAQLLGLPATGTIPHALVELFATEEEAFTAVAETFARYTLLLDTYNPRRAIHTAVDVARRSAARLRHVLTAVRLDGGDLQGDSRYVRGVLDAAGMGDVAILASGDLDEFSIAELEAAGTPIDGYGVGTSLGVGAGSAERGIGGGSLGGVYKLVAYRGPSGLAVAKLKTAGEKSTWPGAKQAYRIGCYERDVIALAHEPAPEGGIPLLEPVLRGGALVPGQAPSLGEIRERARGHMETLPDGYRRIIDARPYPVTFSDALVRMREVTIAELQSESSGRVHDGRGS